jgi:mono/diheme cytochrome c family protein
MNSGALSDAADWLRRTSAFVPRDPGPDLMRAACYRQMERMESWQRCIESAKGKNASAAQLSRETKLEQIQNGRFYEGAEQDIEGMVDAGASMQDVAAAFVRGYLVSDDTAKAKLFLDGWLKDSPNDPHAVYMYGVYWQWLGDRDQAESQFKRTVEMQPRHELARSALARLFEQQHLLDRSYAEYEELRRHCPASESGPIGMSRIHRQRTQLDAARNIMAPWAARSEVSRDVALEMGQIETEAGRYSDAIRWFGQGNADLSNDIDLLTVAGVALALADRGTEAAPLFDRVRNLITQSGKTYNLQTQLVMVPSDAAAAEQLRELLSPDPGTQPRSAAVLPAPQLPAPSVPPVGRNLYVSHCSACHGADGDGDGRAARHLWPRPRNLRADRFRLVSSSNGVASNEDIVRCLKTGMPGTSMKAYSSLSSDELEELARYVKSMQGAGIRRRCENAAAEEGEQADEAEIKTLVERLTTAENPIQVPTIGETNAEAVRRGNVSYAKQGCKSCHGADGVGVSEPELKDDEGRVTRSRDLVREPFKGGKEPASIYLRLAAGMPGTPHPASSTLSSEDLIDLVQYCRSLTRQPELALTNHERANFATARAYLERIQE